MPLRSVMLRDDAKLQACLTSDPAHVVPNARGDHVARIQKALLLVDKANLDASELRGKFYGASTTAAVLAFKRKRKIINFSYQTQADNIVGKMTIARLDEDVLALEGRTTPNRAACGSAGGGAAIASVASRSAIGETAPALKNHGKALSFLWQDTQAAADLGGSARLAFSFVQRARELMAPHGLDFARSAEEPFGLNVGPVVPDFERVITGSSASCFSVRAAAERTLVTSPATLRVICCPFSDKDQGFNGVTDGGTLADWTFPKFVLINVQKHNPDNATLLHEMIHAAGAPFPPHDPDPRSVYAETGAPRDKLQVAHAAKLAESFFATDRPRR
jgi:hypothetical protein